MNIIVRRCSRSDYRMAPSLPPLREEKGIRKLTFLLKCTFGAVVWHELSLIDHELSLIIFDDWLRRAKGS